MIADPIFYSSYVIKSVQEWLLRDLRERYFYNFGHPLAYPEGRDCLDFCAHLSVFNRELSIDIPCNEVIEPLQLHLAL